MILSNAAKEKDEENKWATMHSFSKTLLRPRVLHHIEDMIDFEHDMIAHEAEAYSWGLAAQAQGEEMPPYQAAIPALNMFVTGVVDDNPNFNVIIEPIQPAAAEAGEGEGNEDGAAGDEENDLAIAAAAGVFEVGEGDEEMGGPEVQNIAEEDAQFVEELVGPAQEPVAGEDGEAVEEGE